MTVETLQDVTFDQRRGGRLALLQEFWSYFRENRTPVEYEDLPDNLVNALIATEDIRFEEHSGIDPEAMARVAASTSCCESRRRATSSVCSTACRR